MLSFLVYDWDGHNASEDDFLGSAYIVLNPVSDSMPCYSVCNGGGVYIRGLTMVYSSWKFLFPSYRITKIISPGQLPDFYSLHTKNRFHVPVYSFIFCPITQSNSDVDLLCKYIVTLRELTLFTGGGVGANRKIACVQNMLPPRKSRTTFLPPPSNPVHWNFAPTSQHDSHIHSKL